MHSEMDENLVDGILTIIEKIGYNVDVVIFL